MANEKISAMTLAPFVNNADTIPIVVSGANNKTTRAEILTAGTDGHIVLKGASGAQARMEDDLGGSVVVCDNPSVSILGETVILTGGFGGSSSFIMGVGGNVESVCDGSSEFYFHDPTFATEFKISAFTGIISATSVNGFRCNPNNIATPFWATPAPIWLDDIINRLALAVSTMLGTPIP
jgi:hypothetical protein